MSEDIREEMKKLKEEIASLKDQLKEVGRGERRHEGGLYIDIGGTVHDYTDDVMQSVAEGVQGELEKSIFIGPGGTRIITRGRPFHREPEESVDLAQAATVMSALGHEHRLRILNELMNGGKYINELQEKLREITTSTLSSHLDVLEKAGLVVQEKMRGRYLITIPGRTAYKMATKIAGLTKLGGEE
jgi:DNA-binding HxlR family transcriptional regulator